MAPRHQRQAKNYRTTVVPSDGGQSALPPSGELSFQFENGLFPTVTVVTRTGFRFVIPYRQSRGTPAFVVKTRMGGASDVNLDASGLCNDQGDTTSPEAEALLKAYTTASAATRRDARRLAVEHRIPQQDFDNRGGVLYLQNLDLLISTLPAGSVPNHPYSVSGIRDRVAYDIKEEKEGPRALLSITIVDQDGVFGVRYVNFDGFVFRVPIDRSPGKRDGVYVVAEGRTDGEYEVDRTSTQYYTFEEADKKLGLYRTHADATSLGAPNEKVKREYDERVQQLKLEEVRFREEKLVNDRVHEAEKEANRLYFNQRETLLREHDLELRRLEQLVAERELNYKYYSQRQKETANDREFGRREALEILKFVPAFVTGVAGLIVAVKKLASS